MNITKVGWARIFINVRFDLSLDTEVQFPTWVRNVNVFGACFEFKLLKSLVAALLCSRTISISRPSRILIRIEKSDPDRHHIKSRIQIGIKLKV
jgi:hypothetical protein